MQIIKDYKHDDRLRAQLSTLAKDTFGLALEPWYQAGFWDERYVPYSVFEDGCVAANVSLNRVTVVYDGKPHTAAMIGTVMTAQPYRGRGYARQLMDTVLQDCKGDAEFVYLFANDTVLDFYPKFGFTRTEELQCVVSFDGRARQSTAVGEPPRKLRVTRPDDLAVLLRLLETGIPAPKRLLVPTIRALVLFYCTSVYEDSVFYYLSRDLLVFYHDGVLLDYYSGAPMSLADVCGLVAPEKGELPLGFTPIWEDELACRYRVYDDNLFTTNPAPVAGGAMFPSLSRA